VGNGDERKLSLGGFRRLIGGRIEAGGRAPAGAAGDGEEQIDIDAAAASAGIVVQEIGDRRPGAASELAVGTADIIALRVERGLQFGQFIGTEEARPVGRGRGKALTVVEGRGVETVALDATDGAAEIGRLAGTVLEEADAGLAVIGEGAALPVGGAIGLAAVDIDALERRIAHAGAKVVQGQIGIPEPIDAVAGEADRRRGGKRNLGRHGREQQVAIRAGQIAGDRATIVGLPLGNGLTGAAAHDAVRRAGIVAEGVELLLDCPHILARQAGGCRRLRCFTGLGPLPGSLERKTHHVAETDLGNGRPSAEQDTQNNDETGQQKLDGPGLTQSNNSQQRQCTATISGQYSCPASSGKHRRSLGSVRRRRGSRRS
jgi:hypothetical protein